MAAPATPNKLVSLAVPATFQSGDAATGIFHDVGASNYTAITTSGTTTVNANPCVWYNAICYVLATATGAITVLDGTNTLTPNVTQTAAGAITGWTSYQTGIRCKTSLVVITSGTNANSWNILWD